ncbi:SPRY-domain-containing protein [Lentinula raphanica]|nr:SPRY-domain-containing protein [Lentinula raphanica]
MTSRPSRSASIPIPRSSASTSPTRNIESVISIPFINSGGRPRLQSSGSRTVSDDHRGVVAHGVRGSTASSSFSTSPVRATARSFTQPAGSHIRSPARPVTTHEPRIIHADSSRIIDSSCLPSSSTSSVRTRRTSTTGAPASGMQRTRSTSGIHSTPTPISFPRPTYLDHSSFKHLLQVDTQDTLLSMNTEAGTKPTLSDNEEDSSVSPPPSRPAVISIASPDEVMKLPTRWSYESRSSLLSLSENGRELSFQGQNCNGDRDAAAARSIQPIPPACGIYYYEIEIHSKGQKAHISVGFAGPDVKPSRLPGWEPSSWGYHGDDGCSFAAERHGTPYGPTFGLGDVVGCGIDFSTNRAFFTKNGTYLGSVFENVGKYTPIHPAVGLQHVGESVKVNFGHEKFLFDIDYYVLQERQKTWARIMSRPLDPTLFRSPAMSDGTAGDVEPLLPEVSEEQSKHTINKLVLSYLAHHGYVKTMKAFQNQTRNTSEETPSSPPSFDDDVEMDGIIGPSTPPLSTNAFEADIEARTQIVNCVLAGDIDAALAKTRQHYPSALDAEEGVMFVKLRCRKFVELVLESAELEKKMKAVASKEASKEEDHMGMMDVDGDGDSMVSESVIANGSARMSGYDPERSSGITELQVVTRQYEAALNSALAYGQSLDNDFKITHNLAIKNIFTQTFAILSVSDPLSAGGSITEVAGYNARVQLANELNQAILRSQGRPSNPALEMMYRQTAVCLLHLGLSQVGAAAFANMQKELLDA